MGNNTKSTTSVGKVTLHVWTSNWGGAAAAEALNKWDGGRAPRGSGLTPSPVLWSAGITSENTPREICEDIGSNLCNLVHFGAKSAF